MVGIAAFASFVSPVSIPPAGNGRGFVPTRKTGRAPARSRCGRAPFRFTEDRAARLAARSCTSSDSRFVRAASELHSSRHWAPPAAFIETFDLNDLAGGRRSEQAKLTACRKVWRIYRRVGGKSRSEVPKKSGVFATRRDSDARLCAYPLSRIAAIALTRLRA